MVLTIARTFFNFRILRALHLPNLFTFKEHRHSDGILIDGLIYIEEVILFEKRVHIQIG
jgi:hypothetical protein